MTLPVLMLLSSGLAAPVDIVITAERSPRRVMPPMIEIREAELRERQPTSAANAVDGLPGVSVRTNSRGETIARVRGSEERQTQVFLDGAPMAVPWDGRADIGVLPAGLIGAVRETKGAVPIEYGPNAVAGAVDLETRSGGPARIVASASVGSLGFAEGALVATLPAGGVDLTFAATGFTRDAEPVADLDALPFSQPRSRRRLNSDLDATSFFGSAAFGRGPVRVRASVLHAEAARGIAPESDRDPAINAPRYWRYPDIRLTQANLGSMIDLGVRTSLRLVGWRQWFSQTIDQYRDASYAIVRARERDEDDTLGGRLVLSSALGPATIRLVGTAQSSRHAQVDQSPPGAPGPELVYRQNLYSAGAEADVGLGRGRATFGIAYDHSANPETGDKPAQRDRGALALSGAYRLPIGPRWTLTASGGRRNRFPSARELFGEALGRFLPNPALKPEQAWLGDIELRYDSGAVTAAINPFVVRMRDVIAQRVATVDGRRLRQRYNLSGSTSYGVDAAVQGRLSAKLKLEAAAIWLRARADDGTAAFRRLPQRPSLELEAAVSFEPVEKSSVRAEIRHVGPAVDIDASGNKARLKAGTEVNLRGRWEVATLPGRQRLALTTSIDNLGDATITPQLGLPLPGRSVRVGFQIY